MDSNRKVIAILIAFSVISAISGILQNIASNLIPESWRPYLWVAWPLFIIFTIAGIFLAITQLRVENKERDEKTGETHFPARPSSNHAEQYEAQRVLELQAQVYELTSRKPVRSLSSSLTWLELKRIAHKITQGSMSRVANRYSTDLYQPREDLQEQFQAFLESDKVCFVLVGNSGAGKSNFLLSLDDQRLNLFPHICPIVYDGACLNSYQPIGVTLAQDFELILATDHSVDIWREIQQIEGVENKKVVLCIDAINENPNASNLLKQIDHMVRITAWPWLKIVLTSRPEAWRLIKSNVLLGESRYYQVQHGELFGEKDFFTASTEIQPFNQDEVQSAYENYKKAYKLLTEFEELSLDVVTALRDPLVLRLEAQMHQNGRIPLQIKNRDVIRDYIRYLTIGDSSTRRLEEEDIRFLQEELMPLMIQEGTNRNNITLEKIRAADSQGSSISLEARVIGDKRPNSKRLNQPFINLVDSQILTYIGQGDDLQISFTYERYWDYFGGIRLYELAKPSPVPEDRYCSIINQIRQYPYMWGVLQEALVYVLRSGDTQTIISLAQKDNQDARDLATTALIEHAGIDLDMVHHILQNLSPDWGKRILRKADENRALTAIEVAGYLKDEQILEHALAASSIRLQDRAVIAAYYLWCEDRERGFRLLQRITSTIRFRSLLFDRGKILSASSLSLLIFFKHFQDADRPDLAVLDIWKPAILRILFFNPTVQRGERFKTILRTQVLKLVVFVSYRFLASIPNRYLVINLHELNEYYQLPPPVKEHAKKLASYLESGRHDREAFKDALEELFSMQANGTLVNNMLLKLLVDYCLLSWGLEETHPAIRVNQVFAEKELQRPDQVKRIMWDKSWVNAALAMFCSDNFDEEAFESYTNYVRTCFKEVKQWRGALSSYAYLGYSDYVYAFMQKYQQTEVPLMKELLDWSVFRSEYQKTLDILEEMGYLAGSQYWTVMLNIIEPVLVYAHIKPVSTQETDEVEKIEKKLVDILSTAYHRHPFEVETYLYKHDVPKAFRERIMIRKTEERIAGDLLKGGLGAWGKFEAIQGFSPTGRIFMIQIFRNALTEKSLNKFILWVSKEAVNLMTGENVFVFDKTMPNSISKSTNQEQ
jgi:hypothetical protein